MPDASAYQILQFFGMQNTSVIQQPADPYVGKIPKPAIMPDPMLYPSALNTPVMSDITLGDVRGDKAANNTWTDLKGFTRSFQPVRYSTVIVTVSQAKKIVKTEIQGRDTGTVKEYIGLGDYEVSITGMIVGANGVYPRQEVAALKDILDAPIAIVVTSWYLQLLGIHSIVVDSYDIGQVEGGYSYQPFSIRASSDTPVELKII